MLSWWFADKYGNWDVINYPAAFQFREQRAYKRTPCSLYNHNSWHMAMYHQTLRRLHYAMGAVFTYTNHKPLLHPLILLTYHLPCHNTIGFLQKKRNNI